MKIVVSGGTGFIGRPLCRLLAANGHDVVVLRRHSGPAKSPAGAMDAGIASIPWDGINHGPWEEALQGTAVVINLAGEPIADRRWTRSRKHAIVQSRVGTTRLLVEACAALSSAPRILINGSAIGYYGSCGDEPLSEDSKPGSGFLADLCRDWEQAAASAKSLGMRVVQLRTGMVLGRDGGALSRMMLPFRLFLGGPIAPGTQWISWIHLEDMIELIHWSITTSSVSGPVNAVAPGAVRTQEFAATLGRVLRRPSWLPVPTAALRLALGEVSALLISGQRVKPTVALAHGFSFRYDSLFPALSDTVGST